MSPAYSGCFGDPEAVERYQRYRCYEYRPHAQYKGMTIERAYDGPQAKAMYRAITADGTIIVSVNLDGAKRRITAYLEE